MDITNIPLYNGISMDPRIPFHIVEYPIRPDFSIYKAEGRKAKSLLLDHEIIAFRSLWLSFKSLPI